MSVLWGMRFVLRRGPGCVTHGMCGCSSHTSIPPFACRQIRAVNLKFFLDGVPRRCRFETTHVAAVTKLGLRITANNVVVGNLGHPVGLLLF